MSRKTWVLVADADEEEGDRQAEDDPREVLLHLFLRRAG